MTWVNFCFVRYDIILFWCLRSFGGILKALYGRVKLRCNPTSRVVFKAREAARSESSIKTMALADVMRLFEKHLRILFVAFMFLP